MVVPIRNSQRAVIGTLGVANASERTFTSEEIASLQASGAELRRFAP
jgi:hypothetical protein